MNAITVGQLINNNATDKDFKPLPNLDFKYGPYSSIAEALSNIPAELRAVGLTVGIRVNSTIQEFWFNGGVRDAKDPDLYVLNHTETVFLTPGGNLEVSIFSIKDGSRIGEPSYMYMIDNIGDFQRAVIFNNTTNALQNKYKNVE